MTVEQIKTILSMVKYPGFSRDIVSFGLVKEIEVDDSNQPRLVLKVQTKDPKVPEQIYKDIQAAFEKEAPQTTPYIDLQVQDIPDTSTGNQSAPALGTSAIPGVKQVIAVASGKGGVGKSTVATNLAISLAKQGLAVGLCDCDLYGPSVALMCGEQEQQPLANEKEEIIPIEAHGIKTMSMGYLVSEDSPVIVRGPLATRYIQQFLHQVAWGELDLLVLDLPPGTGDIQLTIVQQIALNGAVIVTTPQEVSLIDARKAISMFAKVNVPILGLIENMAYFECAHGERYEIFGQGGGVREAQQQGVALLAQLPIDSATRQGGDKGVPIATQQEKKSEMAQQFEALATELKDLLRK